MTVTATASRIRRPDRPPLRLRLLGQGLSLAIAARPGAWRLLRRPTQRFWERSAASWDHRIKPDRAEHLAPLEAACAQLDREPQTILELGTGTGAGSRMLARRFQTARVRAVDLSSAMIDVARGNVPAELAHRIELEVADAASLPYEDETFDLVAQLNMPVYLQQAARVLRPDGYLIIASSLGSATPYYTPERLLREGCKRHGLAPIATGQTNPGSWFLARRTRQTTT